MPQNIDEAIIAPYGTWESLIEVKAVSEKSVSQEDILIDPVLSTLYHIESRPEQNGRNIVVDSRSGREIIGTEWDIRTGVHEYGGAAAVVHDTVLIFSNFADGQVYTANVCGESNPKRITSNPAHRFADFAVHPQHPYLIICILEDHTHDATSAEIISSLVVIDTRQDASHTVTPLLSGADFYSSPRFNPDGSALVWCQWNHPDMPWHGSQIFIASVQASANRIILCSEGIPITRLAGEPGAISAVQPTWLDAHTLIFFNDCSGYQNPWISKLDPESSDTKSFSVDTRPLLLHGVNQDFVDPAWWLGGSNVAVLNSDHILLSGSKDGRHWLHIVTLDGTITTVKCPYVQITHLRRISDHTVAFLGTKVDEARNLVLCSFDDSFNPNYTTIKTSQPEKQSSSTDYSSWISVPQPITLITDSSLMRNGDESPRIVHVLYFAPKNPAYLGPPDDKPCAILNIHGGPTSCESQGFDMQKQYFTSRGWAWIDVNYGGSSNYGRQYSERIMGNWGIADVEDCTFAVKELASAKYSLIDPDRVVIRGRSAGGFTTLCTLGQSNTPKQIFAAGTSIYGVTDLQSLAKGIHKFQAWYVPRLLGGTYAEIPGVYRARSPIFHAQNIKVPLLILHGSADTIVPIEQAEAIVNAIKEQDGEAEYVIFEGEGHSWREAKHIEYALQKEASFYSRVLGLKGCKV